MLQENRSHDNYFGRMGQYRRDRGFTDPFDELPLTNTLPDKAGHPVQTVPFPDDVPREPEPGVERESLRREQWADEQLHEDHRFSAVDDRS